MNHGFISVPAVSHTAPGPACFSQRYFIFIRLKGGINCMPPGDFIYMDGKD